MPIWHLYCLQTVEAGELSVLLFDRGNIEVGVQVGQEDDLIWKVAYPLEPLVGQWVGSGGIAFEIVILMQIGLGWVALGKTGLG